MVMLPVLMSIVVLYVDDVDVDCSSILTVVFAAGQRIAQEEEPSSGPDRGEEAACSRSRRLIAETSSS